MYSYVFPVEQLSTAFVFTLMILSALSMYALARNLSWSRTLSLGLSLAWAFSCYTRARAKVHGAMVGVYHLPLIFLALYLVVKGKGWRSLLAAAMALLLAGTTAHYYLVTTIFLAPFFLLFVALQPGTGQAWKKITLRLCLAVLPLLCFLGWNNFYTVPSDARISTTDSYPKGSVIGENETHPYVYIFAARAIDYLSGDIALNSDPREAPKDLNWFRLQVSEYISSNLEDSNPHERTNGIRWSILILASLGVASLLFRKHVGDAYTTRNILFFAVFAGFTFWLSLAPFKTLEAASPSYWLHSLVSQIRVPSRAGINFHFALLMITGFYLSARAAQASKWKKVLLYPGVFVGLMIADYPPLIQNMPMASVRPAYSDLQRERGACGAGMYFPFISFYNENNLYYQFLQRMRGSDCTILNALTTPQKIRWMTYQFPPTTEYVNRLPFEQTTVETLEKLVRCVPLTWIAFDGSLPKTWVKATCSRLGWTLNETDMTCLAPIKSTPLARYPDACA